MKRVVADSNVIISGLNWRGKPHQVLNLAGSGRMQLAISHAILDETSRILQDKLGWSSERVALAREEIRGFTTHVTPAETLDAVPGDPSGNRILECAVAAAAEVIVSGDCTCDGLAASMASRFRRPRTSSPPFGPGAVGKGARIHTRSLHARPAQ